MLQQIRHNEDMAATAYIALGSNLGDRQETIHRALQELREHPQIVVGRVSALHETAPVGGPAGQGPYLNAAAELQTELSPRELLHVLLDVEHQLGRVREERFGPRTLDLDLLLYDDVVQEESDLVLPHPRMHNRLFVLQPLAEIAPETLHPVLRKTIQQLLTETSSPKHSPRELTGLRAVVTGATSGIGRAIALELASGGADVIVHGRRADIGEEVVHQILGLGVQSEFLSVDLREPGARGRLVDVAWNAWGSIDAWINNAGADTLTGDAAQWSFPRKWQELLAVDVTATMLVSREVGRRMKSAGAGVILNMGWDQAETGMEGDSGELFAAAKAAIMAFSKSLALSLSPEVRVNCLAPGWIRTAWGETASEPWQERVRRETPLQRWGTPTDVATAARWLVSPTAAYITGQIIRINGGAVR